jgi:hypothetical protein
MSPFFKGITSQDASASDFFKYFCAARETKIIFVVENLKRKDKTALDQLFD